VIQQDLGRVFLNIANNAFYAVHEKKKREGASFDPRVSFNTSQKEDCIEVRIRDNGDGIDASSMAKIFTPFFTTKPTGSGTGLGLSISRNIIVNLHHGELSFNSEKGVYTEFLIKLPLQVEKKASENKNHQ